VGSNRAVHARLSQGGAALTFKQPNVEGTGAPVSAPSRPAQEALGDLLHCIAKALCKRGVESGVRVVWIRGLEAVSPHKTSASRAFSAEFDLEPGGLSRASRSGPTDEVGKAVVRPGQHPKDQLKGTTWHAEWHTLIPVDITAG
jgi:hypothetical protein